MIKKPYSVKRAFHPNNEATTNNINITFVEK